MIFPLILAALAFVVLGVSSALLAYAKYRRRKLDERMTTDESRKT
jgi:hypothetical protein